MTLTEEEITCMALHLMKKLNLQYKAQGNILGSDALLAISTLDPRRKNIPAIGTLTQRKLQ